MVSKYSMSVSSIDKLEARRGRARDGGHQLDLPPTSRRLTSRQRQAAARREPMLKTALKLFAAQGFDATSTRQIAREVGIAEGLIFHYFPTKANLLAAILEDRVEERRAFRRELRPLLEDAADKPVSEVLRSVASGWLATVRRDEEIVVVLFTAAQVNPEVRT